MTAPKASQPAHCSNQNNLRPFSSAPAALSRTRSPMPLDLRPARSATPCPSEFITSVFLNRSRKTESHLYTIQYDERIKTRDGPVGFEPVARKFRVLFHGPHVHHDHKIHHARHVVALLHLGSLRNLALEAIELFMWRGARRHADRDHARDPHPHRRRIELRNLRLNGARCAQLLQTTLDSRRRQAHFFADGCGDAPRINLKESQYP